MFDWLNVTKHKGLLLGDYAFAIPNGAHLAGNDRQRATQIAALKRQGLKAGIPDVCLAIAQTPYHGLLIELKRIGAPKPNVDQQEWHRKLIEQGYRVAVCYGFEEAQRVVKTYFGLR